MQHFCIFYDYKICKNVANKVWRDECESFEYNLDTKEKLDSNKMEDLIGKTPLIKDCKRLETLKENLQLIMRVIVKTEYRGKIDIYLLLKVIEILTCQIIGWRNQ